MTKYVLLADSFPGNLTFIYDSKGYLVEFAANSWQLEEETHRGVLKALGYCLTANGFLEWIKGFRYQVTKEDIDLSFERFYEMYAMKRNGLRAEKIWNKLSEKEKYYTLINLKAYLRYRKRNPKYTALYPDTYLTYNRKDDWDRIEAFKK